MAPALNFERYNDWTKQNELYPKKSEFPSHVNPTFSILYNKILKMVKNGNNTSEANPNFLNTLR